MSDNRKAPAEGDGIAASIHDPLAETFPATAEGRVLFWIAVAFSSFQLITAAGLISLPSQVVRSIHAAGDGRCRLHNGRDPRHPIS